ncbi:hypothetical protein Bbelb_424150 [Branchiostoma belcheri]|nr:hypothetical protein Bbelb_424150 [Branchiostoma belcheri]
MRKEQRHMLIVLLLILKEVHMPGAQCSSISNGWLKSVDIDDNQIPVLPPSAHDIFSAIRWVLMEKNPWQCDFCGPVALVLIGSIILIIGCKGRTRNPPSGQNPNAVVINTHSTATVMADGDDHYEDIDNHHDETGQDQTKTQSLKAGNRKTEKSNKVLAALKQNPMYATEMARGDNHQYEDIDNLHDQTGQEQQTSIEMASGDDHQYEDIDNHHGQTGQGKFQAIYETNTNTTAAVIHVASGHDNNEYMNQQNQTGQGQCPAITDAEPDTKPTEIISGHDQTRQGPYQAVTQSLDVKNPTYTTTPSVSQPLHSLYTGVGQTLYIGMRSEPNSTRSACAGPGKPVEEKVPAGPPQDEPPLLPPHSKCTSAQPPPHTTETSA